MKTLLFRNYGLKLSAIILSVFLWLFITSRGQSELSLEVPLQFRNIPQGFGIVANSAKTIAVTVRGQERLMKNVRPSEIQVSVDLERAKKGEGSYFINLNDIKVPSSLSVVNISPSSVKVKIDEVVMKTVPLRPVVTGTPEKGMSVRTVSSKPQNVTIQGLKTEVRKISEIRTEPLDITGLSESITQEVGLDIAGASIKSDTTSAKITVEIAGRKK